MPFSRKTTRKLSQHIIGINELNRTNHRVTCEMENLGLWTSKLNDVDVRLVPISLVCYGWFLPKGDIYVPAVTGAQLSDLYTGHHTRLIDVLRHEWSHALADRRPRLVKNRHFRDVFGGYYESPCAVDEYHPDQHLTPYAASKPCEDFAETFHFYLRHKGRLPVRLQSKVEIVRKWDFIQQMTEWMRNLT